MEEIPTFDHKLGDTNGLIGCARKLGAATNGTWIKSICWITRLASQTGPEKGTVSLLAYTLVHEWDSIVVGLVTGLARVWNPESYGWVTGSRQSENNGY